MKSVELIYYNSLKLEHPDERTVSTIRSRYDGIADELYERAKIDKMLPFVAQFLIRCGISVDVWSRILASYRARNSRILADVTELFSEFRRNGLTGIYPVENFAALIASDEDIALFASGDVDLFSQGNDHGKLDGIMQKIGWIPYEKSEYLGYRYRKENAPAGINLMWRWQAKKNAPLDSHFSDCILGTDHKMRRGIPCLSSEELMYSCLIHASVHDFVKKPGIRLLFDVVLLSKKSVDWNAILQYAREDGYENRVVAAVYLAHLLLGANIPQYLITPDAINERTKKLLQIVLQGDPPRAEKWCCVKA